MERQWIRDLRAQMPKLQMEEQAPLSDYTSFRIGGPADCMVFPASEEEMASVLRFVRERELPWLLLGAGSNVLAPDEGLDGVVIQTKKEMQDLHAAADDPDAIVALCGVTLSRLSVFAAQRGLTGLEFAQGIPGTVGGGVVMNAGAYGGEMKDCAVQTWTLTAEGSQISYLGEEQGFRYRGSAISDDGNSVCAVRFRLRRGDPEQIQETMRDLAARRKEKQPLDLPSAGSTFKRPAGGYAAALIDQAGLKGLQVGGAAVSEKHAGFVVNLGEATAEDVKRLINLIQERVLESSGISLEPEVRILRGRENV